MKRRGIARWRGDLETGEGNVSTESAVLDAAFDAASRYADGENTSPEELIGAAHAACYSMALANLIDEEGYDPDNVTTDATVDLETEDEPRITAVHLVVRGRADEIDEERFQQLAQQATEESLVANVFGGLATDVQASLETPTPG